MTADIRKNPFTVSGFAEVDTVVANVLKRGRNGDGYTVGFDFSDRSGIHRTATLTPFEADEIRHHVDSAEDAKGCVIAVALVLNEARNRANIGF